MMLLTCLARTLQSLGVLSLLIGYATLLWSGQQTPKETRVRKTLLILAIVALVASAVWLNYRQAADEIEQARDRAEMREAIQEMRSHDRGR